MMETVGWYQGGLDGTCLKPITTRSIGHFSFDKILQRIKSAYWWSKMRRFVKKYVESCLKCAHSKSQGGKRAVELYPVHKANCPFQTIHFDHVGPFVRSRRKNSYLFIIIDAYTKFIVLIPLLNY